MKFHVTRALNQETTLKQARETCWGLHYGSILNIVAIVPSLVDVLDFIMENGLNSQQIGKA